jgi:hypothetical protein
MILVKIKTLKRIKELEVKSESYDFKHRHCHERIFC